MFRFSAFLRRRAAAPFSHSFPNSPSTAAKKDQPGAKKHKAAERARLQTLAIKTLTLPSHMQFCCM